MILAFDTSTSACTAALFAADGNLLARADEVTERGHAERLAPLLADLVAGNVPTAILVGVGPGSFTGLRIGIACAHGMAVGWDIPVHGMDSLALLAAGAPGSGLVAVAVNGGHGEIFVAQYQRPGFQRLGEAANLRPEVAAGLVSPSLVVGNGAAALVAARGSGQAIDMLPSAANAMLLDPAVRSLPPSPIYARPPDAIPAAAA